MKYTILGILIISVFTIKAQQDSLSYQIYNAAGEQVQWEELVTGVSEADVVFFGELHGDSICHILEQKLAKDLHQIHGEKLVLGGEMWESDQQLIIDEYMHNIISKKAFTADARLWANNQSDYQPYLDFAKEQQLSFVATNIPRRYANAVYVFGIDQLDLLDKQAKSYIMPLRKFAVKEELSIYREIADFAHGHGGEGLIAAQAVKDATMAYFIAQNMPKKGLFLHINGNYHSKKSEGIPSYLLDIKKKVQVKNIHCIHQPTVEFPEEEAAGDFVIVIRDL